MTRDQFADARGLLVGHQAEVDGHTRAGGHGVGRTATHFAGANAADVERGEHDALAQGGVVRFGTREAQGGAQRVVGVRQRLPQRAVVLGNGRHVVVEAGDLHAAVHIAHTGNEVRHRHAGVGRPVAVVSAVQGAVGTVEGHVHAHHAAHAKHQLRRPAHVGGTIEEQPRVGGERRLVRLEQVAQVRRAGFFLAFQEELHVHRGRLLRGLERVEGGQHGDDRALVVAGRARADTHGGINGVALGRHGHGVGGHAVFVATQLGGERIAVPSAPGHRLSVVVRVHHDGARGAGRLKLAEERRTAARGRAQRPHSHAAFGEGRREKLHVAPDVRGVGGHVGDGHQGERFVEDLALVGLPPRIHGGTELALKRRGSESGEGDHGEGGRHESTMQ